MEDSRQDDRQQCRQHCRTAGRGTGSGAGRQAARQDSSAGSGARQQTEVQDDRQYGRTAVQDGSAGQQAAEQDDRQRCRQRSTGALPRRSPQPSPCCLHRPQGCSLQPNPPLPSGAPRTPAEPPGLGKLSSLLASIQTARSVLASSRGLPSPYQELSPL